ncbi:AMP-binding protein [Nonomuraea glycinis]|nr:AMP-binding protein [Nonomuraea glycinis]MCA2181229.1 AMP-binding protein [Nonomuraea glycinis]
MTGPVVISGRRVLPVAEMKERAARLASGLRQLGVGPGDRYAIMMRNETGMLEATFAASLIGAVPVPVNWHWTGADLRHLLSDSQAKVVVVHSDLVPIVEAQKPERLRIVEVAVPPEVAEEFALGTVAPTGRYPMAEQLIEDNDPPAESVLTPPMSVIYTSGTTGLAKGVLRDPIAPEKAGDIAGLLRQVVGFRAGGTAVIPAPLYHTAPNVAATYALAMGMSLVIMPKFDAEQFLRVVAEHRATAAQMVPTMFVRLLRLPQDIREKYDLSSLENVSHSAAPCPPDIKRAMIDWFGPTISEYYGGSEGGAWTVCTSEQWLAHPGTVGAPVGDAAIRILGPDRTEVPAGETGVVYGRPPSAWPDFTYLGDDAKRRAIDAGDGFYTLGDVGHVDKDGYLYLSDRLNDMVISGGVNIYPVEIENTVLGLAGVADVAVFGIPDADFGEALAAHVELLPDATVTEDQVREHVERNLAKYKVPKVVVFEARLPREDSGKLFKRRLREQYWPAHG